VRDTFLKRSVDHYSVELLKELKITETTILNSYDNFSKVEAFEETVDKPVEFLKYELKCPNI